jgi:hypothetical protein
MKPPKGPRRSQVAAAVLLTVAMTLVPLAVGGCRLRPPPGPDDPPPLSDILEDLDWNLTEPAAAAGKEGVYELSAYNPGRAGVPIRPGGLPRGRSGG